VRAVIEVKGAISNSEVHSHVDACIDFAQKWRTTQLFYLDHHQALSDAPTLMAMCWSIAKRKDGKPMTDPAKIRTLISGLYKQNVNVEELDAFPLLSNLYIYD
jgi:hypothetical protein